MTRQRLAALQRSTPCWQTFLLVFLLAVAARLAYAFTLHPAGLIWHDEILYDAIARRLLATGRYVSFPYDAAPGWPAVLATTYAIFGHHYAAARAVQAVLGGLLSLVVAGTGTLLFDRLTGLLAGLFTALYPPLIYLAAVLYADHLAAVLVASTLCALAWWQRRRGAGPLILAGILAAGAALTRSVYLILPPLITVYVLVQAPGRGRLRQALLPLTVALLGIAPWTIRNAVTFHHFVPVSTGFGLQLWRGNNEVSRGDADDRHLMPLGPMWRQRVAALPTAEQNQLLAHETAFAGELQSLDPVEQDARLRTEAVAWIRAHPGRFVELAGARLLTLYSPYSHTASRNGMGSARQVVAAALSLLPVLLLGLGGVVIILRRKRHAWILPGVILATTGVYVLLTASTRFRLPLDPLWITLAAVAGSALITHARRGTTRLPGGGAADFEAGTDYRPRPGGRDSALARP